MPPLMVVLPRKLLAPEIVTVPVPVLARLRLPEVLANLPANEKVWSLAPTVSVGVPLPPSIVPAPLRPLIVWLYPARFKVPARLTFPQPAPEGIWSAAPSCRVAPPESVVVP